jgi:hypothetical protein
MCVFIFKESTYQAPQTGPITGPSKGARKYIAIAFPLSSGCHISLSTPPPTYIKKYQVFDQKYHNGTRTAKGALPPIPDKKRKAMS